MKLGKQPVLRFLTVLLSILTITGNVISQDSSLMLTREQALEDFRWLRFSLEYVHPRLYKYDDKFTVNARFDSLMQLIRSDISGMDFLSLVTVTNATVHCGHLYSIPQGKLEREVLAKKVLPFHVKILDGRIYLMYDCSKSPIPNGSQIFSINGRSGAQIIGAILPGIAADGFIQTRKLKLMERYFNYTFQGFDLYYQLFVDRTDSFRIEYLDSKTKIRKTVIEKGIGIQERETLLLKNYGVDELSWFTTASPKFEINVKDDFASLTVSRSFYDKKVDPDFDSLLNVTFRMIKEKKINNLILDLRGNEGGSEDQQMKLMSYLYHKPFKLYQNIYLSHLDFRPLKTIILERDTAALLFKNEDEYMRKVNDNLWINNYEYSDNLQLKPPKPDVFTGNLFVLMNGLCFSSAADLISDLKKTTAAVFIGEEPGGTLEGPTGGDEIVIQLPNSKIMVRISPNIQVGYMNQKTTIGRGVMPTYPINYTIEDILNNKDLELALAKKLIRDKVK